MTRRTRRRVLSLAAAVAGLAVAGLAGPAMALAASDATPAAAPAGYLGLYADAGLTRPVLSLTYQSCPWPVMRAVHGQVGSFRNLPAAGCQVVLKQAAGSFTLCVGSGTVPPAFGQSPRVYIQPGRSVPCLVESVVGSGDRS